VLERWIIFEGSIGVPPFASQIRQHALKIRKVSDASAEAPSPKRVDRFTKSSNVLQRVRTAQLKAVRFHAGSLKLIKAFFEKLRLI
jgi:hypothetical protein